MSTQINTKEENMPASRLSRSKSRLEAFRTDIEQLHQKGWKPVQIKEWLEAERNLRTSTSAIYRMLKKTEESNGTGEQPEECSLPSPTPPAAGISNREPAEATDEIASGHDNEAGSNQISDAAFAELREILHDLKTLAERQIDSSNRLAPRLENAGKLLRRQSSRAVLMGSLVAAVGLVIATAAIVYGAYRQMQLKMERLSRSYAEVSGVAKALEQKGIRLGFYQGAESRHGKGMKAVVFEGDIQETFLDDAGRAIVVLEDPGHRQ